MPVMVFKAILFVFLFLPALVTAQPSNAFVASGETMKSSNPRSNIIIYKYDKAVGRFSRVQEIAFGHEGMLGEVHQISMVNKKRIFAAIGTGNRPPFNLCYFEQGAL
ncbi:MAG: hypothetical protein Q9N62_05605 [Ghiorsea sp.]|nr:hypothetical protein [Ghiorsea sp.]